MPSIDYLIQRGARFKNGDPVIKAEAPKQEPVAPLVAEAKIDASPIAEVIEKLSGSVGEAMESQRRILEALSENMQRKPEIQEVWEFKIQRDGKGRIESITANKTTDQ